MGFDYPYAPEPMMGAEIDRFFAFDGFSEQQKAVIAATNALALFPRLAAAEVR